MELTRQFKVGDLIVHPYYGVGQVVEIAQNQFSKQELCLYYKITLPKRVLWIPVEAHKGPGLRLVTAKGELDQYRNLLRSPALALPKNYHQRHLELDKRLKESSFQVLCEVVRDLTAANSQKALGSKDAATLRKTRESLCEEWAAAAALSVAEAVKEVGTLLQVAQPYPEVV
jgi:RNA polymerase-interacting CarD/CdnL/TRCF family regulator